MRTKQELREAAKFVSSATIANRKDNYGNMLAQAWLEENPVGEVGPLHELVGCKVVAIGNDHSILADGPGGRRCRYWPPILEDDDTLIDAEWLRSINTEFVGWNDGDVVGDVVVNRIYLYGQDQGSVVYTLFIDGEQFGDYRTRGDIRKLCDVLGVPLKS